MKIFLKCQTWVKTTRPYLLLVETVIEVAFYMGVMANNQ